jgi:cytochrome c-type biogenesis protein CcmH
VIPFIVIAALAAAAAVFWLLRPLLARDAQARAAIDRTQTNLAILRGQLAELDAELARGAISAAEHAESKAELERRVLEETTAAAAAGAPPRRGGRALAGALGVALPLAAAGLYLALGEPGALDPQARVAAGHSEQPSRQEIEAMVARLDQRLQSEPDNVEGWAMLARSYFLMQRYADSVRAYERLAQLLPQEPGVLADYADALAMRDGRRLTGRPLELVLRALALDPNHPKALAMAGSEAFDRKDYKTAVQYWERLHAVLPADSEFAANVAASIAEARTAGGLGPAPAAKGAAPPSVQGTVQLAPALAGKAAPTDAVFVFARAVDGPRAPLAVLKLQVKDLPAQFSLDDSLAMAPQFALSKFDAVTIGARVSKSGRAEPSAGDLEGATGAVKVGARGVIVTIDRVVP